jgi:PAS domain S-box-containing protein
MNGVWIGSPVGGETGAQRAVICLAVPMGGVVIGRNVGMVHPTSASPVRRCQRVAGTVEEGLSPLHPHPRDTSHPSPVRKRGRTLPATRRDPRPRSTDDSSALREAQANAERVGARLVRTLESVTDAFYTLDRSWRFTYVNPEAERLQQRTRAELLGNVVWDVFPEAVGTVFDIEFHRAVATGETVIFESYYAPLDLWVAMRAFPSDDGLAVYFLDINDKRLAEQALLASERRYRALFERAGDAILIADDSGHWVDANAAASELLGVARDQIVGQTLNDFVVDALDGMDVDAAWTALRAVGELRGEVRLRRPSGEVLEAEYTAVADISPGLHLGVLRDITERRRHERSAAQRERIMDALRRLAPGDDPEATANAICAEIVDHGEFPSAAIYGFGLEDRITALGARLHDGGGPGDLPPLSSLRMAALQSRAAGGPWVDDLSAPGDVAARALISGLGIQTVAFAPIESDGRLLGLLVAGADETRAELVRRVPALVEFAALASSLLGPGLRRRSERSVERARIRDIIASGAFRPVFQPIVEMATGSVIGFEALTRFDDGTPPDHTFLAATEVGVGLELEAATIAAALEAADPLPAGAFLDINVSPDMIMAVEPLRMLIGRSAAEVVLEITEHVGIEDYVALREAVASLGNDVRFAVDDTGAGFASMRHILELAPSHVKLDRGLITRIDTDPARQALVTGLVHFAEAIDAMLIAEGVETVAERDELIRLGVRFGQGYLLGRPAPATAVVNAPGRPIT